MADQLTKRKYKSTIRAELDHTGKSTKREVHIRIEILENEGTEQEKVVDSEDIRVELDAQAFAEAIGEIHAAALEQIEELTTANTALTKERDAALASKAETEVEKMAVLAQKKQIEDAKAVVDTAYTNATSTISTLQSNLTKTQTELETTKATKEQLEKELEVLKNPPDKKVTMDQFIIALSRADYGDDFKKYSSELNEDSEEHIFWNRAPTILRSSSMLTKLAQSLALSKDTLDELFAVAETV